MSNYNSIHLSVAASRGPESREVGAHRSYSFYNAMPTATSMTGNMSQQNYWTVPLSLESKFQEYLVYISNGLDGGMFATSKILCP